ncbi:uncharacterized protein METZ01_LOCUS368776 [marine metagenome]|uniref:Uncharacterized protein n=1 Tax=marine metagenome TaxID=408172 RepID=A0A382T272_9ZZZZ
MREKYKRDGVLKQQILFVIPEIHNELSGIYIAGYSLVRQSTYISKKYINTNKKTTNVGLEIIY